MTNYINSSYTSLNNINNICADDINSNQIIFNDTINNIDSVTFNYLQNVTSNIQTQLNNIALTTGVKGDTGAQGVKGDNRAQGLKGDT